MANNKKTTGNIDNEEIVRPVPQTTGPMGGPTTRKVPVLEKGEALPGKYSPETRSNIDMVTPRGPEQTAIPQVKQLEPWQQQTNNAVHGYASAKLGFNPYMTQTGPQMKGMDFNPYHQAARNTADSQASAGLGQTAGMSASDRMRSFSDFNRAKITGQLGASAKVGQAQAQNMTDVGRFNAGRALDVNVANTDAFNMASQHRADAMQRRDQNLYAGAMGEKNLGRQLEISKLLGESQMPGQQQSLWNTIMDPLDIVKPGNQKWLDPLNSHKWF